VQRFNCISVLFRFWSRVLWSAAASASRLICTSAPPYTYTYTSCVPFGRLGRASEGERESEGSAPCAVLRDVAAGLHFKR